MPEIDARKPTLRMIITRGLPGSGKSTWAKQFAQGHADFVRVCRDDLRSMLFGTNNKRRPEYDKKLEEVVRSTRDHIIAGAMCNGYNIVVDECGLYNHTLERLWKLADHIEAECGQHVTVEFKNFTGVDIDLCIERDSGRPDKVGEDVIRGMFKQWQEEEKKRDTARQRRMDQIVEGD